MAYLAIGVDLEGRKYALGCWIHDTEGAEFWQKVAIDLRNRGVHDILIACCNGSTGLPDAIRAIYPDTVVQTCVVHVIRNAARCHRAAIEGHWATTMRFFAGPGLLVIDELGHLPLPAEAASALFQIVSQRYLKTSILIITTRGVRAWGEILGDTTVAAPMLDRLPHRSIVVNPDGESIACATTTPPPKPCDEPQSAPANHRPRVGNFNRREFEDRKAFRAKIKWRTEREGRTNHLKRSYGWNRTSRPPSPASEPTAEAESSPTTWSRSAR